MKRNLVGIMAVTAMIVVSLAYAQQNSTISYSLNGLSNTTTTSTSSSSTQTTISNVFLPNSISNTVSNGISSNNASNTQSNSPNGIINVISNTALNSTSNTVLSIPISNSVSNVPLNITNGISAGAAPNTANVPQLTSQTKIFEPPSTSGPFTWQGAGWYELPSGVNIPATGMLPGVPYWVTNRPS